MSLFEIMSIEKNTTSIEQIDEYINKQLQQKAVVREGRKDIHKVDLHRNPRSQQLKLLKALVRIDHQPSDRQYDHRHR